MSFDQDYAMNARTHMQAQLCAAVVFPLSHLSQSLDIHVILQIAFSLLEVQQLWRMGSVLLDIQNSDTIIFLLILVDEFCLKLIMDFPFYQCLHGCGSLKSPMTKYQLINLRRDRFPPHINSSIAK